LEALTYRYPLLIPLPAKYQNLTIQCSDAEFGTILHWHNMLPFFCFQAQLDHRIALLAKSSENIDESALQEKARVAGQK